MRLGTFAIVILDIILKVQGKPGEPGADWSSEETEIIFQNILSIFTNVEDAIAEYDKKHGTTSEVIYDYATRPNPAKARIQLC